MFNWRFLTQRLVMLILTIFILLTSWWIFDQENFYLALKASWRILNPDSYYKQQTTPLSLDIAKELCLEFRIPVSDSKCEGQKVYAIDFYPVIVEYYLVLPNKDRSLSTVQDKIGKYQIRVEKKIKNGVYDYWYWYDFTGDQTFPLIIVFDESGTMIDIFSTAGRDS